MVLNFARLTSLALLITFVGISCKKKDDDETSQGSLNLAFKPTGNPTAAALLDASASDFLNSSIASGAPESLTLNVKSMSLKTADGKSKTIFSEAAAKAIVVGSKVVDISGLFTQYACVDGSGVPVTGITECPCGLSAEGTAVAKNSDGTCPDSGQGAVGSMQVDEGVFTSLDIEFTVAAKVKGCVTGNFSTVQSNDASTQGSHTYCTKESATTFQATPGVAAASELEGSLATAESMDYQIVKYNGLYTDATKTQLMSFPIKGGVTVSKDSATTPTLTMVIDTNRMLRFYNMNKVQSPNPGMASDRAYFFSTVFEESTFVFVGMPGDIRGFQWWTEACANNTTGADCTGDKTVVAGWMTVVKDKDSKPLLVGLMPDDDNSLTIIKGSNKNENGIDSSLFVSSGDNYDIGFRLGSDSSGTLKGVNLDAELSSTQTASFIGLSTYGGRLYLRRAL